ncbi:nucleotide sugar dehydrogenase [Symbiobacterium thermophilum]|uniref:UDP-N-acetyl-D-mannosamine dehydrogenase n=1 Tax=Symbiobacterium thermophilum TaxID=2734 RepID=A0A953I2Q0_SYMTR|nr:nucleotide sugar dehydrogenase [Symbiobacterium thermophilum]MBY6277292.1 UDP-N-acetyl-D-mannosamine dehydrogenase [Symbiobacterium thermophilum]
MKICVIGMGYIGFPTACLLASAGHHVVGVDVNVSVLDTLRNGQLHIVNEAGLADLYDSVFINGHLVVSDRPSEADAFILAVPTPFLHDPVAAENRQGESAAQGYRADLRYVENATRSIAPFLRPGNLVILESTVPPGTTENVVVRALQEEGVDVSSLLFAHAPERVLPGNLLHELVHNDRIVGGLTQEAGEAAASLYKSFVQGHISITDARTAELVKLMENTYRDVNIALANEFAKVCEYLHIDVWEAMSLANRHPRVNFLRPGPGVGGHCIPIDPYFVIEVAPAVTDLIQAARRVNRGMPHHVLQLLLRLAGGEPLRRVAILGASYKANVGDERESPSLEIAQLLREAGMTVAIHDPYVPPYNTSLETVLEGADAILLLTDHEAYQAIDPHFVRTLVARALLLDTRGLFNPSEWESAGFVVLRLGDGRKSALLESRIIQ